MLMQGFWAVHDVGVLVATLERLYFSFVAVF